MVCGFIMNLFRPRQGLQRYEVGELAIERRAKKAAQR